MLQKHRLQDAVLKASKENRILYDMSFKNDEPNRTPEKRDSMWRCRYEERGGSEDEIGGDRV